MITSQQAAAMPPQHRIAAMRQIEAALSRNPRNLDALMSGAAIHYADRRHRVTVEWLEKALALSKKDTTIMRWIAVAASEGRDLRTAKIHSRKLCEMEPANPENWHIRGRTLDMAGDVDGALAAYERVRRIVGDHPNVLFDIATCLFHKGEMEKAEAAYLQVADRNPNHALALYGYSTIHRFKPEEADAFVARVEKALPAQKGQPEYHVSALYYAAAKAREDAGDLDAAFEYYRKANDVRRPGDASRLTAQFEANRAAFTPALLESRKGWGSPADAAIFVLGMPRSGTTLVESIAAAHPAVTAAGELSFLDMIGHELGEMTAPAADFARTIAALPRDGVAALAERYLDSARQVTGPAKRFIDKMPHNFMHVGLILLLMPNARIIHCNRHPLDTCLSIYTNGMTPAHNYYKSDLATLGRYYRAYEDLMAYWRGLFPGRILDVHYEDMVVNTELNARRIIDFLGLDWDDRVLTRQNSQKAVKTLSAWQVRQPVYTSSTGKWRRFEKHLGPLVEALGDSVSRYEARLRAIDAGAASAGDEGRTG